MMDRERAIEELETLKGECWDEWLSPKQYDDRVLALNMAIKVLEQESCEDCVSREAMLDYQQYLHGKMSNEENHKLYKFIKDLPSVRPTQIKGKWLNKGTNGYNFYGKCSKCGQEFCVGSWYTQNMKYCPNCGARMGNNDDIR